MPEELKLVVSAEDRASRIFGEIGRVASETFRRIRSQITYTNRALGRLEERAAPLFVTFARRAETDALPAIGKVSAELKKVFGEISAALGESSKRMTALGRVSERALARIVRGVERGKKGLDDFGTTGEKAVWGVLGMVVALDRAMWGLPPPLRRTAEIVTSLIGLWRIAGREMWRIAPFVGVVASLSLALTGLAAVVGVVSRAFREMYGLVEKTIKLGAEYESLIVRVKIVSDLSSASLRDMSAEFAELATQIPISAAELMKIAREAAKLGIEGREDILAFTRTVAVGAIVTGESAATITDRLGRVALAFGLPIKEAGRLLETLHVLAIKGPQEVDEIIIAMRKMAPAAKILGLPIEVSAALGAALTAMGVSAARAGTQVYRALVEMTKATDEQLTAAGVDVLEFRRALEIEPAEAIRLLLESLARLERRSDRLRAATELLGSVGAKAFALLAANVEEYDKYLELANRTMLEGAEFAEALAEISITTRARYQMLRAEIERMAYALWNEIQPAVAGSVRELHFMVKALSESETAQAALGRAAEILSGIFGAGVVAIRGVVISLDDYWKILTDIPPSIRLLIRLIGRLASLFITAEEKTRDFSDILGRTTFVLVKATEAVLDFGASFIKLGAYIFSVFPPLGGFLMRLSWLLDVTRKNVAEQAEHTTAWKIVEKAIKDSGLKISEQNKLLEALRKGQIEPLIRRLEELGFSVRISSGEFEKLEAPAKLTERRLEEVGKILEKLFHHMEVTGEAFVALRVAKERGQIGAKAYSAVLQKMAPVFRILRSLTEALGGALSDIGTEFKKTGESSRKAGEALKFTTDVDKKYREALIKMIEAQVIAGKRMLQGEFEAKRFAAALRTGKESLDLHGRSAEELENCLRRLMQQTDQLSLTYGKLMGALEKQIRGEKARRTEIIGLIQDEKELTEALQKHLGLTAKEAAAIAEARKRLEEQRRATLELIDEYWSQLSVLNRLKIARQLLKEAIYGEAEAYEKARVRMVQAISDQIRAIADFREKFKVLFREISSGTIRNVEDMQRAGASIVGDLQNILETGKEVDYNLVLEWQRAMEEMRRIAGYTGEEIPAVWKRIDDAITRSATAARIIWTEVAMRMGSTFEHLRDFWFEISDAMYRAFADAIFLMMTESEDKLKQLEAIFTSFVRSVARAIAEFIAKEFVREFFRLLARGAGGMAGGGIVVPAFRAAQRGEVVRGPALRLVGEREPEAIVPLPGGRAIPVEIRRERERPITVVNVVDPESIYRAIMDRPDVVWNLVSFDIARGGITQRTIRGYRRLV